MFALKRVMPVLLFLVFAPSVNAQTATVKAELDSTAIFIGGQVGLNVTVTAPRNLKCHVLSLPDTLGNTVEVVERLKPDTTFEGDLVQYVSRYLLCSFDSGQHYVAPQPIVILPDSSTVSTPDFSLGVYNPFQQLQYDEQTGVALITDIRSAEDAPFLWKELLLYWPWAIVLLAVAALVVAGFFFYRKYGSFGGIEREKKQPDEPCEVIALRELERIKEEKLWMHGRVKDFYSDLTETLRRYVGVRFRVSAMESTTVQLLDELALPLKEHKEDAEILRHILEMADFAKFAKMEPLPDENDRALSQAVLFVKTTTDRVRETDKDGEKTKQDIESPDSIKDSNV